MKKYIIALDEGTTSARAIIFDRDGEQVSLAQSDFTQYYPQSGWVEQDAMEIWGVQSGVLREVLETSGIRPEEIAAIGITNQRETTVVWDKSTGKPIYNAIVWQCRRTAERADQLRDEGWEEYIRETTGLVIDGYFSATKIEWILDNVEGARDRAERGELLFGTMDTWILWNLTRGQVHATDYSNASRTMMYDIHNLCWDEKILEELRIPKAMLPEVKPSSYVYGYTDRNTLGGAEIPIAGIGGDQQSALFGQGAFESGMVKNTYGTGSFILMNTGDEPIYSDEGLLTTIAWGIDGKITYALEGSVFVAGAAIQWLRDEIGLIRHVYDSEYFATKVQDTGGVYVVPAFTGLGAPYWDPYARGMIIGIDRGTNREHIIRATLESIAYQSKDVIDAMVKDCIDMGIDLKELYVDGGAAANDFLMEFQSDILGVPVIRPDNLETTALGAAYLAGLAVGFFKDLEEIRDKALVDRRFVPEMKVEKREELYNRWQKAVRHSLGWME